MTSRERVWAAVNHRQPDRVPIDLGGMKASGVNAIAYHALKKRLGITTPTRILDPRFMIAVVEEEVLKRFHADVLPVDLSGIAAAVRPESEWVPRRLFDGTPVLFPPGTAIREDADGGWTLLNTDGAASSFRMPRGGYYFDDTSFNRGDGIDPAKFKPQSDIPDETLRLMADYTARLHRDTPYALLGWGFGVCFLGLSLITDRANNVTQGMPDEWMMMLMTEKETCHQIMSRSVDAAISCLRLVDEALSDACFAWGIASDDSGTQRSEFIAPDLWAEMMKPHYARLCAWIHGHTKMKTYLHSCGSIPRLIPHMIDAGVDILNPVQTSAAGMDPRTLKESFGDRMVFWGGGCDTQTVLPGGTPDEVRAHVKERMEIFAPGGGYVFTQVHNIQARIPVENVLAMLDAAYSYGGAAGLTAAGAPRGAQPSR
jgi:uroporphyrinogen decarboxylase